MRSTSFDNAPESDAYRKESSRAERAAPRAIVPRRRAEPQRASPNGLQEPSPESRIDADLKTDWIALLSHELRNPVGAIGIGLELVKARSSEPQPLAAVEMMQRQVAQIVSVLDALLDAARLTADKLDIRREPVDLGRVIADALDTVRRLVDERGHEMSVVLPPAGTIWVTGDHIRLVEVVINVLANAAKYTPRCGRVALALTADAETALITVRDSGIGIKQDFLPRVFDLFSQGDRASDGDRRGLGLGLPLARDHVRLHGGSIAAFSKGEGQGSRFEIRLPRVWPKPTFGMAPQGLGRPAQPAARRVLIVEDEPDQLNALQQWLELHGHETRAALNGPAALAVVPTFEPEVALIDLGLPGMDGHELARRLRKDLPHAMFIAVTGYREGFGKRGPADFDHHLMKPIDLGRLSTCLAEAGLQSR
jgi:signal transduction histidine kinase